MGRLRPARLTEAGVSLPGDVLIETGTCSGHGVRSVASLFNKVHTIECDRKMYVNARRRLRRIGVHCELGHSPRVLRKIINPARHTVFWLDAHYVKGFGTEVRTVKNQCPLLAELKVIF